MGTITFRVRSLVWFVTGAALAAVVAVMFMNAWRVDAAPGDDDATFVPTTPCRLADTRPAPDRVGPAGTLSAAGTQTFAVHGTNGECTIPAEAVAVSLNVTALGASTQTFLTFWPDGARPLAASLNPAPGQPPTPNAVTVDLSGAGAFNVFNNAGTVDIVMDVNGYYTQASLQDLHGRVAALETAGVPEAVLDRLDALEAENAELKALTASMSIETVDSQPTVRFTGVNVQVVDGSGETAGEVNGRGNLIVGYNENSSDTRTGSHNLVVGEVHSYSSYGGFVAGFNNTISGVYSSVSGGQSNTASNGVSSVTGGSSNTASGFASSVSGGDDNTASGFASSVSGGRDNFATREASSVSGGQLNTASGIASSVSGGDENTASSAVSSVSGGDGNTASGSRSSVSGGIGGEASGTNSSVSGGFQRTATGSDDWTGGDLSSNG